MTHGSNWQSRHLRVCFLMPSFYPVVHGATIQIMSLAQRLLERGMEVVVVTRKIERDQRREETVRGIRVLRGPIVAGLRRSGKFLMVPGALWTLVRHRSAYDLIVVSDLSVLGAVGILASWLGGKKCLLRAESCGEMDIGLWLGENRDEHPVGSTLVRFLAPLRDRWLGRANGLLSISRVITEEFRRSGVPDEKIIEITNGIDTRRFSPVTRERRLELRSRLELPEGRILAYAGRLASGKGIEWLIEAWAPLTRSRPDLHLLLIGGGQGLTRDIDERLRAAVARHGISNRVRFTGLVDNVHEYLQAADFFVLPSQSEALGIALLEGMACGLPSVATAVGGILDIIEPGVNGLLVEYGDSAGLRDALEALMTSKELQNRLSFKGRETVCERFDIERIADQYVDLFSRLIEPAAAR